MSKVMKAVDSSAGTQQYSWSHCFWSRHSARVLSKKACRRFSVEEEDEGSGSSFVLVLGLVLVLDPIFASIFSTRPAATASARVTLWWDQPMGLPRSVMSRMRSLKTVLAPRWVEMISSWPPQVVTGLATR